MNDGNRQSRAFSRGEWSLAVALVSLLVLLTLAGGRSFVRASETARFEAASAAALRSVGERVIEMRGVMKSMLGMHYASDEFGGVDIEAFAEQLRTYSPFVRSIGMFGAVDDTLRVDYEAYHAERNLMPFAIHAWEESGERRAVSEARYLPVESVDPLDEIGRRFLGTDLGSVAAIAEPLGRTVSSGKGIVADIPPGWPIAGDALLLQPVYLSTQPPADEEERLETHLGGIWIAIDLAGALQGAFEDLPEASTELSLDGRTDVSGPLFGDAGRAVSDGLDLALGRAEAERSWMVGESRLTMRVAAPLRASADDVSLVGFCALLAALLGSTATAIVYQRRLVRHERALSAEAVEIERGEGQAHAGLDQRRGHRHRRRGRMPLRQPERARVVRPGRRARRRRAARPGDAVRARRQRPGARARRARHRGRCRGERAMRDRRARLGRASHRLHLRADVLAHGRQPRGARATSSWCSRTSAASAR